MNKMKLGIIITISAILIVVLAIFGIQSSQNRAFILEEQVNTAQSDIKIQEKRRVDLIYNLVDCVKEYDKHEANTLTAIVEGRGSTGDIENVTTAITAVSEAYPELKSSDNYKELMNELSVTENLIANYRGDYNRVVKEYKQSVRKFPNSFLLGLTGYEVQNYEYLSYEGNEAAPATFLEIGNAEITYRELIVSVGIVFIMLILGSVIAGNITRDSLEQKKEYNTAISIESENMFDYGIRTNVGNAFCQGALEAVDTVSDSRIDGQWMYIYCEEKHYTMHTRTVTTTDSKGHTKTRVETYWTWDYYSSEEHNSKNITFLGKEFKYGDIKMPSSKYLTTVQVSPHVKFEFYVKEVHYDGTLFANLSDESIHDAQFIKDKNIEEARDYMISAAGTRVIWFWVFWVVLMVVAVGAFYVAENRWLED